MKNQIENNTVHVDKKEDGVMITSSEISNLPPLSFKNKVHKLFTFLTVEPFMFFFVLPSALVRLAAQRIYTEKACRVDLNYTSEICQGVVNALGGNITEEARSAATIMVSNMTGWQSPLQSSIPAILILFLGTWSDKTGNRKALMLLLAMGEIVANFSMLLATYYFDEWPLWITAIISALPTALCGGEIVALMGTYSYIADITDEESRTYRLGLFSIIPVIAYPIGSSVSGIIMKNLGYFGMFGITFFIYVIAFVYTYFRIHNVREVKVEGTYFEKFADFLHPRHIWNLICLIIKSTKQRRIMILLVICAHMVLSGPIVGGMSLTYYYTLKRYKMTEVQYSILDTYLAIMSIAGTAIAITLFSKYLKMHDAILGNIAILSTIVASFVYGLAPSQAWYFSGAAFGFFGPAAMIASRSISTKMVESDRVGQICSLIGLTDSLIPVIYIPIFTQIYSHTIDTTPGAFYFARGALFIPALFIFFALYILDRKQREDTVKNPDDKELHAYDNAISSL